MLMTVATAGVVSVGLLAPGVLITSSKLGLIPKPRDKEIIKRSVKSLKDKGLIKVENDHYVVTEAGRRALILWEFGQQPRKPRKWDGKWRVVIFDIPEKIKKVRQQVRIILRGAGFIRLQDSVWVHPYDCEDIVMLLKTELGIRKHMLYMIVDEIEDDAKLKREFNLL